MARPYAQASDYAIIAWLNSDEGLREFGALCALGVRARLALENDPALPLPAMAPQPHATVVYGQSAPSWAGGKVEVCGFTYKRADFVVPPPSVLVVAKIAVGALDNLQAQFTEATTLLALAAEKLDAGETRVLARRIRVFLENGK